MAKKKSKFGSQMPADLLRRLKMAAARDGLAMDDLVTTAVEQLLIKRRGRHVYDRLCGIEDRLERIEAQLTPDGTWAQLLNDLREFGESFQKPKETT